MSRLGELLRDFDSVSIIGMCKNAGKTTVLNRLIQYYAGLGRCLGLTSIGRDGEDRDLVTGTHKPGIYAPEGSLIATAAELLLHRCDMSRELLLTTGIATPLGEVVLFRARSDGNVQLAGPSMTSQLAALREEFFALGAQSLLIDGALSRKSLCSRSVSQACVLCTGASYHRDIRRVVEDTAYQCRLLTLPQCPEEELRAFARREPEFRGCRIFGDGESWLLPGQMGLEDALRRPEAAGARVLLFGGALTDFLLKPLLMSSARLQGLRFVVRDSSRLLLSRESFEKLQRRGVQLQVLDSVNLVAVTVNPFSAYGGHFSKDELSDRMAAAVALPVINVMEEEV